MGDGLIAPDWWIQEAGSEEEAGRYRDEPRVSVAAVVSEVGIRREFLYRYDMGDGWAHRIVIEAPPASTVSNPRLLVCMAGENGCPPENVGGPHGGTSLDQACFIDNQLIYCIFRISRNTKLRN